MKGNVATRACRYMLTTHGRPYGKDGQNALQEPPKDARRELTAPKAPETGSPCLSLIALKCRCIFPEQMVESSHSREKPEVHGPPNCLRER